MLAYFVSIFVAQTTCLDYQGWSRTGCTYTATNATVNMPNSFLQTSTFNLNGNVAKWDYEQTSPRKGALNQPRTLIVNNNTQVMIKNGIVIFPMISVQGNHALITYQNVTLQLKDFNTAYPITAVSRRPKFIAFYTAEIDHVFDNVKIDLKNPIQCVVARQYPELMQNPTIFAGINNMTYFVRNTQLLQIPEYSPVLFNNYASYTDNLFFIINNTKYESTNFDSFLNFDSVINILPAWGACNLQGVVNLYNIQDLGGNTGPILPTFQLNYQSGMVQAQVIYLEPDNTASRYDSIFRGTCKSCQAVNLYSLNSLANRNQLIRQLPFFPMCIINFKEQTCKAPLKLQTRFQDTISRVNILGNSERTTMRNTPKSVWAALGLGVAAALVL